MRWIVGALGRPCRLLQEAHFQIRIGLFTLCGWIRTLQHEHQHSRNLAPQGRALTTSIPMMLIAVSAIFGVLAERAGIETRIGDFCFLKAAPTVTTSTALPETLAATSQGGRF